MILGPFLFPSTLRPHIDILVLAEAALIYVHVVLIGLDAAPCLCVSLRFLGVGVDLSAGEVVGELCARWE